MVFVLNSPYSSEKQLFKWYSALCCVRFFLTLSFIFCFMFLSSSSSLTYFTSTQFSFISALPDTYQRFPAMSTGHHEERLAQKPLLETFLVISALTRYRGFVFFSGLEVNLVSDYFLDHSRASNPLLEGFPDGSVGKECLQCGKHRRCGFVSWVGRIRWRRKWQTTPVFFPEKSHGQRRLAGYRSWGHKSDMTGRLSMHTQPFIITMFILLWKFWQLLLLLHNCYPLFFFSCYWQFGQGSWLKAFHFLAVGSTDSNNLFWPVSPCYRDLLTFPVTGLGTFM